MKPQDTLGVVLRAIAEWLLCYKFWCNLICHISQWLHGSGTTLVSKNHSFKIMLGINCIISTTGCVVKLF